MRKLILLLALALGACALGPDNDPIYLALKANPPKSIPARHLPKLRRGIVSCDVFNEGKASQYMTCWWPSGLPPQTAYLAYYGPYLLSPPNPSKIHTPGGAGVTGFLPIR